jgi:hypothetical protein
MRLLLERFLLLERTVGRPGAPCRRAIPIVFLACVTMLVPLAPAIAGNEPAGDDNRVVFQNPSPQLSANALRSLVAAKIGGLDIGYALVLITIEAGKATEVRTLMSSGSIIADREICQFVLDHWVFNPKAQGVYKFPVLLPAGLQ